MSAVPAAPLSYPWPADLLAFATRNKVDAYLDPLLNVLRKLFPTAISLEVALELDPEIRDDWHIVFEMEVPKADVPDYLVAKRRWHEESLCICPAPLICTFRLILTRVP